MPQNGNEKKDIGSELRIIATIQGVISTLIVALIQSMIQAGIYPIFLGYLLPISPLVTILIVAYLIYLLKDYFIIRGRVSKIKTKYKPSYSRIKKSMKRIKQMRRQRSVFKQGVNYDIEMEKLEKEFIKLESKELKEIEEACLI